MRLQVAMMLAELLACEKSYLFGGCWTFCGLERTTSSYFPINFGSAMITPDA
jgi:hypothetical protein